jgi:hypothetical protein
MVMKKAIPFVLALIFLSLLAVPVIAAPNVGQNGTTLAGYKTLDICAVDDTTWRYSGVISVWNEGAIDTVGFNITDFIESKTEGPVWTKAFDVPVTYSGEIPAGTTELHALTFPYSIDEAPLTGSIRNNAVLTITNHSGHLGELFGPNPKATYSGTMPPPPCKEKDMGCTYTQGYWGSKPGVIWPDPYKRTDIFYLSEKTWQEVFDLSVNLSPGYLQLAHQYIAAVLNQANGAYVPDGVQDTLDLAQPWFEAKTLSECTDKSSCGTQKDWAKTLDDYNNGVYPGGPSHCGDEPEMYTTMNWWGWQFELRLPLVITK